MAYDTYNSNLTYPTDATTTVDPAVAAAAVGVTFLVLFIVFAITYVASSYLLSRIFKKAGVPQWIAWVPVYNSWKTLELGNQQGFWAVLALVPFVNIVSTIFLYIAMFHIGKKLGKEDWFILIAIFLPVVWIIWLAFDDSTWEGRKKVVTETTAKKSTKKPTKKVS